MMIGQMPTANSQVSTETDLGTISRQQTRRAGGQPSRQSSWSASSFIVGPYVADLQVSTIVMPTLAVVMGAIGTGATLLLRGQRYRFARA
jgi:hypothetical protein